MSKATRHFFKSSLIWSVNAVFVFWILPLGVFIKPTQEQKACNGRRAICLCTNLLKKALNKRTAEHAINQTAAPQKENPNVSPDFLLAAKDLILSTPAQDRRDAYHFNYSFAFVPSVEAVPKTVVLFS